MLFTNRFVRFSDKLGARKEKQKKSSKRRDSSKQFVKTKNGNG